ncbi:F-box domain containing protein [Tanacetum coccineum]
MTPPQLAIVCNTTTTTARHHISPTATSHHRTCHNSTPPHLTHYSTVPQLDTTTPPHPLKYNSSLNPLNDNSYSNPLIGVGCFGVRLNGVRTSQDETVGRELAVDPQSTAISLGLLIQMSADVARSHGGDGGSDDRPPPYQAPTGCMGCFANRGKGKRKPNLGGRAAGRLNTRDKTRNLSLKEITDKKGPVPIRFEVRDKQTLMPLGDHAAHWSSYIGEVIRGVPLYYPSWLKVPKERKAALITDIGTQFDLRPHMESPDWTEINAGIQQHLQKAYNTNKAAFKAQHWVIDPTTGTYNVEKIRRARPEDITAEEWDKYIQFWNDPRNIARAAQNRQNRAKSTVISRQGSRSLARLRDEMRQSSATQEYPSLIDTFFVAHTVNGEFLQDEDRRIYKEMRRLEATRLARRGKQRGHIPGVGRFESGGASGSGGCADDEESADDQEDEDEDGDGDS